MLPHLKMESNQLGECFGGRGREKVLLVGITNYFKDDGNLNLQIFIRIPSDFKNRGDQLQRPSPLAFLCQEDTLLLLKYQGSLTISAATGEGVPPPVILISHSAANRPSNLHSAPAQTEE